jgi:hypothetical protein
MSRVGVDIDGVIYPWDDCARDALVVRFGIERPEPSTSWNFLKERLEPAHWDWLWSAEGQREAFGQEWRAYPGIVGVVKALLREGRHEVHFVTHRDPRRTGVATARYLARQFGGHPWAGLHIVRNSTRKRTLGVWDAFIDDKPETVADFLANTNARVACPVRPWNEGPLRPAAGVEGFLHYDDPAELVEWLA